MQKASFIFFLSFCGCRRYDSGLFTAAVLWNRLRLYTKLLYHPNNPFLTKHKRILLFFFVFPLPRYLSPSSFSVLFCVVMPELLSGTGQQGREVGWGGCKRMALHCRESSREYMLWNLRKKKEGERDQLVVFCPRRKRRKIRGNSN